MKHEKFILSNTNSKIKIKKWKGLLFIPIPVVKTLGFLYHRLIKKNKVYIIFKTHNSDTISLILLISSSHIQIKTIRETMNYFIDFSRKLGAKQIKSIVVNNRLNEQILNRYGWEYIKDNWYIGKHYKLKL